MVLISRIFKAVTFNEKFYRELELDRSNLSHAVLIVLLVGLCNGLGTLNVVSVSIIKEIVFNLIGWFVWSIVLYIIGVKILHYTSDLVELLVYLGFAFSPGIFNVFGLIPHLSYYILTLTFIWTVFTFVYAAKHALNCNYKNAVLVSVVSVIPYIIIRSVLLLI